MTVTYEQLEKGANIAHKLNKINHANTLTDMMRSIKKYGSLTHRQGQYAQMLLESYNDQALAQQAQEESEWQQQWDSDSELREKAAVVASYYLTTPYYNNEARAVRGVINGTEGYRLPSKGKVMRMISNKYAENVWQSHKGEQKWKVGDMVAIRKTYKGSLDMGLKIAMHSYRAQNSNIPMYDELSYMVVQTDSKPISQSYTYDEKRGGCRYYKLLPVGIPTAVHVMECNLKKILKKKVTK